MAEEEKTTEPVQDNTETTETTSDEHMNCHVFTETLKQAQQDLPDPKQGTVMYGDYYKATKDPVVTKATIHFSESGKGYTTSTTEEYTFAHQSVTDENGNHRTDLYAARPEYEKQTVTTENGKNFIKQTMLKHREEYLGKKNGVEQMKVSESQSDYLHQTKGNKTFYQTTRSKASFGERTDSFYTPKVETHITGTAMPSMDEGDKQVGTVNMSTNFKDKTLKADVIYEGEKNKDGTINYTVKNENYCVDDKKTGNTYAYRSNGNGEISGEVWRQSDETGKWTKTGDIEPGKQMKKDFANYRKAMDRAIKQATNYKNAQSYMETVQQGATNTTQEVDGSPQQQSLNYVDQAKQSAQAAILNRTKQKQY